VQTNDTRREDETVRTFRLESPPQAGAYESGGEPPHSKWAAPGAKFSRTRTLTKLLVRFVILWVSAAGVAAAQAVHLTSREAKNHVGEKATVCGKVVGIHFVSSGKGQPTFVHFDEPYPDQIFTLVIWGSDRPKFGRPEVIYRDKELCVTGKITSYLGIPEIVATAPNQVQVQK
jgi:hypothetical protein